VFLGNKRGKMTGWEWPWSATGRLDLPDGNWCTAALVGADIALTNAHCVIDKATGEMAKGDYVFRPGFTDGASKHSSTVNYIWWGTNKPDSYRAGDWAFLRLDKPLGRTAGWLGVSEQGDLQRLKLSICGYSGDFENGRSASWEKDCSFTSGIREEGTILHNCSTSRGSSGSSIFHFAADGKPYAIALNAAEYRDGEASHVNIPYSDARANIAVPARAFLPKLREILGQAAPAAKSPGGGQGPVR
jgi:protease YdgD